MKIVLNKCYGGFGLSPAARRMYEKTEHRKSHNMEEYRTDPALVEIVETLGSMANDDFSKLKIFDMPESTTDYMIYDYDGLEILFYVVDGKLRQA